MSQTTDEGKACAVLAYLLIGIVWFFADKKINRNTFAKFHVKQAIVFMIFILLTNVVVAVFTILSKPFSSIAGIILYAVMTIIWILAIVYAASGQEKRMPVIGVFGKMLDF
jgi:uncharacterized membrane protein